MTEVKFNAENWYEHYSHRLDEGPLRNQASAIIEDPIYEIFVRDDGTITVFTKAYFETRTTARINSEELDLRVKFLRYYSIRYNVETALNNEDASQAERNLQAAIRSGETEFKVPTTAIASKDTTVQVIGSWIYTSDDENLVNSAEFSELLQASLNGGAADLGDFEFLKDYFPTVIPKDERIEFICKIPEESTTSEDQLAEQEFQVEDWMNYYNAELDEADLNDSIDSYYEGHPTAVIDVSGDTITTEVESSLALYMSMFFEDAETGEEIETDAYVVADFTYTVVYKVDNDLDDYIEDIEESLNEAIKSGSSTFAITVPTEVVEVRDVDVTYVEQCQFDDDELAERIAGGESAIIREIKSNIEQDLSEATDARHNGDCIQPPADKDVKFVCTIPAE